MQICEEAQNSKILNWVKFLVHQKMGHGALVDACNFFFVGHELEHAQEALDMCQNAITSKTPTRVDCTAKLSIADLFLMEF